MPVFISYSHKDKSFANNLAANLVKNKAHIWIDDWEVSAGESLIEKIQEALQVSSALIVILSKASVESVWCKKEYISGIQRELEEKQTLVIPALLEDCDIPLFLRDKKYADFRVNFDIGLNSVLESISKVINPRLGRINSPEYHTDWGEESFDFDGLFGMKFFLAQHSEAMPYTVFTEITILCNVEATKRYNNYREAGLEDLGRLVIVSMVVDSINEEFVVLLEDSLSKTQEVDVFDPKLGIGCHLHMESRRLGEDTGKDILMHGTDEIRKIKDMIKYRVKSLTDEEQNRLIEVVKKNQELNYPKHCDRSDS